MEEGLFCLLGANIKSASRCLWADVRARGMPHCETGAKAVWTFLHRRLSQITVGVDVGVHERQMNIIRPALRIWKKPQRLHQCHAPTWSIKTCSGGTQLA